VGLSWLDAHAEDRSIDAANAFTGASRTLGGDFLFKWSPHGDATRHQLKLQAEYFSRAENGLRVSPTAAYLPAPYRTEQSGWYLQSTWLFRPRWRVGLRYDSLDPGAALATSAPRRSTAMLDWSPSEFSRLRVQYALDDARVNERDRQLQLQYLFAIGAHGAHKF
jgi:outer membrane receptor protein involved in Fe transport